MEKFGKMDQQAEKDRKSNRTRQKNKRGDSKVESNDSPEIQDTGGQKNERGDSKVESNDSPEIPDTGETSDIPGPPFRG